MRLPNIDPLLIVFAFMILAAALSGCARPPDVSQPPICLGTINQRNALTDAVLTDGGKQSRIAANNLLRLLDAACNKAR